MPVFHATATKSAAYTRRVANPYSPATHAYSQTRCYAHRRTALPPRTCAVLPTHAARRHMLTVKPAATPIAAHPCRRVHTPCHKPMQPGVTCLQSNPLLRLSPHILAAAYTRHATNPCSPASHACSQTRCYAHRRTALPPYTHTVLQTHAARRHMLAVKPAAKPIAAQPCRHVHTPRCKPMQPGVTCLQSNLLLSLSPHSLAVAYTAALRTSADRRHMLTIRPAAKPIATTALPPPTQPGHKPAQPGGPYRPPGQSGAINTGCRRCG